MRIVLLGLCLLAGCDAKPPEQVPLKTAEIIAATQECDKAGLDVHWVYSMRDYAWTQIIGYQCWPKEKSSR